MTNTEYGWLMDRFRKKLKPMPNNREQAYNEGVKACMSILKNVQEDIYKKETNKW